MNPTFYVSYEDDECPNNPCEIEFADLAMVLHVLAGVLEDNIRNVSITQNEEAA